MAASNKNALKYIFGTLSTFLFAGLIYKLTKLPGGFILPGYILGGMMLIGYIIVSLILTGIVNLIFKPGSFGTVLVIVILIAFLILNYFWYSPTLKIVVPKNYAGQISLVLSNVDKNTLTVDSNGIGYITKWTFDKTYLPPVVMDRDGRVINDFCIGFNSSTFWANGAAASTGIAGEIKYLSFRIIPRDTVAQKQTFSDFTNYVDRSKLIKSE